MSTWHVPDALLDRFAALDRPPAAPDLWSAEAHLERCPRCRERLAVAIEAGSPETLRVVESVRGELGAAIDALPAPARRPRRLTGGLLSTRLLTAVAVVVAAALLDLVAADGAPSLVLLAAPVLPLVGVGASWSRMFDPAYDLVAATPAAGLALLLRRTLVALGVVVPVALLAGLVTEVDGLATWLLPCLALTTATLALGSAMPLERAAAAAGGAWAAGVILPALATQDMPAALDPAWLPAWAALAALAAGTIALRRRAYRWAER